MLPLFIFQLNYQMAQWSYLEIVHGEKQMMQRPLEKMHKSWSV